MYRSGSIRTECKHALKGKIDEDRYQRENEAYSLPFGPDDHNSKVEGEENDQHLVGMTPSPRADEEKDYQWIVDIYPFGGGTDCKELRKQIEVIMDIFCERLSGKPSELTEIGSLPIGKDHG
ncbi:MAG: hypothetical protein MZV64_58995 [Ignavibacteriales bacterium]|nr:hypothetical protein [Ignavibacteriales bacterium]